MRSLAAAVLLAALAGCAGAPAGPEVRTVVVEGWAPEGAGAREAATADAQRRAVEKAFGVAVAAATKVEAAVAVKRRIWAGARGRVENWEVLGERAEAGMLVVRLRADVRRAAEGEAVPPPAEATVRVAGDGAAAAGLRRALGAAGFTVIVGHAEYTAVADARAAGAVRDPRTAPFVTGRARVSVLLSESGTGRIVAERAAEAAGLDADPAAALLAASGEAGERAGAAAAAALTDYLWRH